MCLSILSLICIFHTTKNITRTNILPKIFMSGLKSIQQAKSLRCTLLESLPFTCFLALVNITADYPCHAWSKTHHSKVLRPMITYPKDANTEKLEYWIPRSSNLLLVLIHGIFRLYRKYRIPRGWYVEISLRSSINSCREQKPLGAMLWNMSNTAYVVFFIAFGRVVTRAMLQIYLCNPLNIYVRISLIVNINTVFTHKP